MLISLHKQATTTPKIRAEIQASTEAAWIVGERYGISEQTVWKWRKRDSVLDRSHTPHRLQTTLTPAQEVIAVELRRLLLLPLDDLLAVVREFLNPKVSRSGLDRCLRRHGVGKLKDLKPKAPKPAHKPFKAYEPGYLHIDVKYLPQMADEERRRYLFVAIDRATRWVFVRVYPAKTAANARRFLRELERAAPMKITKVLTDNGKEFTDRLFGLRRRAATGAHAFDRLCADLGIEHRLAPPMRPATNGMVERFNGRIEDVLQSHHFHSGEELEQTLLRYVRLYNGKLPQAALKGRTPIEALKHWHRERPDLFRKRLHIHPGFDTYFHWAARRIIREFPQDDLIVHYLCPISPVQPRFPPPGYQYILGPLNGNVGYPPGFRSRTPWSARLREHFYFAIQHTAGRIFADKRNAARILIAGGERSLKAVVWAGGVVDRVTEVLDSGIPDRLLSQQPVRHSGTNTHMMAAGRLDAYKGFDLAIAAVARAGPDYLLSIHGDGTERANLEALAVRLGVAGRVRFHGWTPHDRLIAAMRGSRALLFPTLAEANGIIMQEAMMVGLPVVALNWGGPAILGANGAAVLVAPTGEISVINDLAEAIRRLASDGAYADAIARSARERAERSFAWRDVAESWSLAYADPARPNPQAC